MKMRINWYNVVIDLLVTWGAGMVLLMVLIALGAPTWLQITVAPLVGWFGMEAMMKVLPPFYFEEKE